MSIIKSLFQNKATKFTPASSEVDWTRIDTLVHGPGAGNEKQSINSALFACLMTLASAYPEPPLVVKRLYRSGDVARRLDHPLQSLLDYPTPNGELSMDEILFWTAWAKHIDGNAYWIKVRSGNAETGNVTELWPVSPTAIEPVTVHNSGNWIDYYKYRIRPNEIVRIPINNVIHFRLGLDDQDMRRGLSPLKALVRQLATDDEADIFVSTLLKNYAIPGLVVVPSQGVRVDEGDADRITARLKQKFGNDNRGNIAVLSKETQIHQFGFSPEQLDMSILHRIPEERISAVIGVPAIVSGLGAGLDRATYANFKEAREMFTEQKLIPLWRADARKLTVSLLNDFQRTRNVFIEFDLTDIRALQEDEDAKYIRLQQAVGKPWMTINEARTDVGLEPVDGGDDLGLNEPDPQPIPPQLQQEQPLDEDEETNDGDLEETLSSKANDLDRWRRKAIKAKKSGRSAAVKFESAYISPVLHGAINGALESAQTLDDVQRVFSDVWIGYP